MLHLGRRRVRKGVRFLTLAGVLFQLTAVPAAPRAGEAACGEAATACDPVLLITCCRTPDTAPTTDAAPASCEDTPREGDPTPFTCTTCDACPVWCSSVFTVDLGWTAPVHFTVSSLLPSPAEDPEPVALEPASPPPKHA